MKIKNTENQLIVNFVKNPEISKIEALELFDQESLNQKDFKLFVKSK